MVHASAAQSRQHLVVVVAADCGGCGRAREVAEEVVRRLPTAVVDVIDVEVGELPEGLPFLGTPTYFYNDRLISMGNPEPDHLVTLLAGAR